MKNVKFLFVLVAAIAFGFASCEKDEVDDKPEDKEVDDKPEDKDDGGSNSSFKSDFAGYWESTYNDDHFTLKEDGTGTYSANSASNADITSWGEGTVWVDNYNTQDGLVIEYDGMEDGYLIKAGGDTLVHGTNQENTFVMSTDGGSTDGGDSSSDKLELEFSDYNDGDELVEDELNGFNILIDIQSPDNFSKMDGDRAKITALYYGTDSTNLSSMDKDEYPDAITNYSAERLYFFSVDPSKNTYYWKMDVDFTIGDKTITQTSDIYSFHPKKKLESINLIEADLFNDEPDMEFEPLESTVDSNYTYYLYRSGSQDGSFEDLDITTTGTFHGGLMGNVSLTDNSATPGITYYYKVVAKNEAGTIKAETEVAEIEVPADEEDDKTYPDEPTISVEMSGNCAVISWESVTDADSYDVYYSTDGSSWTDFQGSVQYVAEDVTGTSAKDCDRGNNVEMYYKVTARNTTGGYASSNVESIMW